MLTVVVLGVSCSRLKSPEPVSFTELCQNREAFQEEHGRREYRDGVVMYIGDRSLFVATYLPLPIGETESSEEHFIVVHASTRDLSVGDIVSVRGRVRVASRKDKTDVKQRVYFLDAGGRRPQKTGRVDVEDPDFEAWVQTVRRKIRADELLDWLLLNFLNPANPASPLYMENPDSPFYEGIH